MTAQAKGIQASALLSNQTIPKGKGKPINIPRGARLKIDKVNLFHNDRLNRKLENCETAKGINKADNINKTKAVRRGNQVALTNVLPIPEKHNNAATTIVNA